MKRMIFMLATSACTLATSAQDTTKRKIDTIRVGGLIIVKGDPSSKHTTVSINNRRKERSSNFSTANFILDLGFANWNDKTDYAAATAGNYIVNKPSGPTLGANDLNLRNGKSSNVNIWFFMQRLNLINHYVNLKYGLGLELNNYRFKSPVSFKESGSNPYMPLQNINHPFVFRDSIAFTKNKLAADYVTIPFMLNFRTNPNSSSKGISLSAGVSVGYLYSTRNKQVSAERGKRKNHGDYEIEKWKFAYIGELGLGPGRLYGSYSPNSLFEKGLKMMPYAIGIRLSNW
jgi:hypothetical protein